MNAVHVGIIAAAAALAITSVASWLQRDRVRLKKAARQADAAGSHGSRRVKDRRSLWARRYGAGGGWTAATWTAGAGGLHLAQTQDGVGCGGGGGCGGGS